MESRSQYGGISGSTASDSGEVVVIWNSYKNKMEKIRTAAEIKRAWIVRGVAILNGVGVGAVGYFGLRFLDLL